ncbi:MAG: hypothetical protein PUE63_04680, partial [Lachnospiraceae bacterium]|nr:hypothetical protein [Lachnospiraceae bacterium]
RKTDTTELKLHRKAEKSELQKTPAGPSLQRKNPEAELNLQETSCSLNSPLVFILQSEYLP